MERITARPKRRHKAHRSRIGVTIGSVAAMVGLTSYMAIAEQPASTASTAVVGTDATVATVATSSGVALSSTLTAATPSTAVAQVTTTTSKGS